MEGLDEIEHGGGKSVAEGREGEAAQREIRRAVCGLLLGGGLVFQVELELANTEVTPAVPATTLALDRSTSPEKLVYLGKRVRARTFVSGSESPRRCLHPRRSRRHLPPFSLHLASGFD